MCQLMSLYAKLFNAVPGEETTHAASMQ